MKKVLIANRGDNGRQAVAAQPDRAPSEAKNGDRAAEHIND